MSFAEKFTKNNSENASATAQIIKKNAYVYALWISQKNDKSAFIIIHVEKAKHTRFAELLQQKQHIDYTQFGEILYQGWSEPTEEEKAIFSDKYGLFNEPTND